MRIDSSTRLTCLLGHPVHHSISPAIHNASYSRVGVNAIYLAFDVLDFPKALDGLKALGAAGCNVTIPYKEVARDSVDWLSDEAELTGAVNTVKFEEKALGYNTDISGVIHSLEILGFRSVESALLIGAGGAARSVLAGLSGRVDRVYITSRRIERVEGILPLCNRLGLDAMAVEWEERSRIAGKVDLLINATPLGTLGEGVPLDPGSLKPGCYVFDLVYNPPETALVREAKRRGCRAVGGLPMLVRQAAEAERIWFGIDPDEDLMMEVAESLLGGGDG